MDVTFGHCSVAAQFEYNWQLSGVSALATSSHSWCHKLVVDAFEATVVASACCTTIVVPTAVVMGLQHSRAACGAQFNLWYSLGSLVGNSNEFRKPKSGKLKSGRFD